MNTLKRKSPELHQPVIKLKLKKIEPSVYSGEVVFFDDNPTNLNTDGDADVSTSSDVTNTPETTTNADTTNAETHVTSSDVSSTRTDTYGSRRMDGGFGRLDGASGRRLADPRVRGLDGAPDSSNDRVNISSDVGSDVYNRS